MHRLDGKEISKQTLLEVIETANAAVLARFRRGMREVRQVDSIEVSPDMLSARNVRLHCEDRRLSIARMGEAYYAVDLSDTSPGFIDPEMFDFMLNASAAMLDLESTDPQQPAFRKVKKNVMDSEGFRYGRVLLESKL